MIIERNNSIYKLKKYLEIFPVVGILGPRQCGKTTLSQQFIDQLDKRDSFHIFDLEDQNDLARLENPLLALEDLQGYIIIDEIQRRPEIFPTLRVLADRKKDTTKFIILGSASRDLIQQGSETLAGRIGFIELTPFTLNNTDDIDKLWLRGGFPLSFLAKSQLDSVIWRKEYISSFLERDIPNLGIRVPARSLRQFWQMLAHYHGSLFNATQLSTSLQISSPTVKKYLDILSGTFMIRQLQPWLNNAKKRIVKSPKIFFRDSGILHTILNIETMDALSKHPFLGASWEGFALEQAISKENLKEEECFFWALHSGADLDLVYEKDGKLIGLEVKYTDYPKLTKSMYSALDELKLDKISVLYPGAKSFKMHEKVEAVSIKDLGG